MVVNIRTAVYTLFIAAVVHGSDPQAVILPAVISALPDDCGYDGRLQYVADDASYQWNLVPCDNTLDDVQLLKNAVFLNQLEQSVIIDLTKSTITLSALFKVLKNYFTLFGNDWFLPNNVNMTTNFTIMFGFGVQHVFTLQAQTPMQTNPFHSLRSNNQLLYLRNGININYVNLNDGNGQGFLDVLANYGNPNPQHPPEVTTYVPRQYELVQLILSMLEIDGPSAAAVLIKLPTLTDEIKTAVFDFLVTTAIVAAVPSQVEATNAVIKTQNSFFDQWVKANQVNLNNVLEPTRNRTPGADDYARFLLHQFLDGNVVNCTSLRDVFWGSGSNIGFYWPIAAQQAIQLNLPVEVEHIDSISDVYSVSSLNALNTLYEQPFGPMPSPNLVLQQLASVKYNAIVTTKIRSAFEGDVANLNFDILAAIKKQFCGFSQFNSNNTCMPDFMKPILNDLKTDFKDLWTNITLSFRNPNTGSKIQVNVTAKPMASKPLTSEWTKAQSLFKNLYADGKGLYTDFQTAMSVYKGFTGSIQDFENGDAIRGILTLNDAIKKSLTLFSSNDGVDKWIKGVFTQAGDKIETAYANSAIGKELPISTIQGIAGGFEDFINGLEFIQGLESDMNAIASDVNALRDANTTVEKVEDSIDLVIDTCILVIDVLKMDPQFKFLAAIEPVLKLIEADLDYFVNDIAYELGKVHDKTFGNELLAVLTGFEEGCIDALTGGLISGLRMVDEAREQTNSILAQFSDTSSFFSSPNQDCSGQNADDIDFTAGKMSAYGGALNFTMFETTYTVTVDDVPLSGNRQGSVSQSYPLCPNSNTVVLGIGESARAVYKSVSANVHLIFNIPVERATVISDLTADANSLFGNYAGNSHNNTFVAVQPPSEYSQRAALYAYTIAGNDGNDTFYLGPERSAISGGNGQDFYFFASNGGVSTIDNFATDNLPDMLYLNTSFKTVSCAKLNDHLSITYSDMHSITVLDWFIYTKQNNERHLAIFAWDDVGEGSVWLQLGIFDMGFNGDMSATCLPVSISRSGYGCPTVCGGETIDLRIEPWRNVTTVVGSDFDDIIRANDLGNYINGAGGSDTIYGGKGGDMFSVQANQGCDTINNFDMDQTSDTLRLGTTFSTLTIKAGSNNYDVIISDANVCVTLKLWLMDPVYQHLTIVTNDSIVSQIQGEINNLTLVPVALDFSSNDVPVNVDLMSAADLQQVTLVKDSMFADRILGNALANTMTCHGADYLVGGEGGETYVISTDCANAQIDNFDSGNTTDVVLLMAKYSDIYLHTSDSVGLEVRNISNGGLFFTLLNWFDTPSSQHLLLATNDGLQSSLPNSVEQLNDWKQKPVPYEIYLSGLNCTSDEVPIRSYDFTQPPYLNVTRFSAQGGECSYNIIGNDLNNYIDPGTGDPFGYQYLQGGLGSDTYVIGHLYGYSNVINNFATDAQTDILQFNVMLKYIEVQTIGNLHVVLSSTSGNDTVAVQLTNYLQNTSYQHLLVQTADGVTLQIMPQYPFIKPLILDYDQSPFSQQIDMTNQMFSNVKVVYGSVVQQNNITANSVTQRIVGGNQDDVITGGISNEQLEGLGGNDTIYGNGGVDTIYGGTGSDTINGGSGDDVIYGGADSDFIDGGPGSDTIVFQGNSNSSEGVYVNLMLGFGVGGDADGDTFINVECVEGSEFDDIILGDNNDNTLNGYGGNDVLSPFSGTDMLYGGLGNDTYNLTDAIGWKSITNYATDLANDIIIANLTSKSVCQYSFAQDLYVHIGPKNSIPTSAYSFSAPNTINLVVWRYFNGSECQHLTLLNSDYTASNISLGTDTNMPVDSVVDLFLANDELQFVSATNQSITVQYSNIVQSVASRDYRIDLAFACDGSTLMAMTDISSLGTNVQITPLPSGIMCSISLVLVRCNQVLTKSKTYHYRTLPNPPINLSVPHLSSITLTAEWQCNSDLNCPLYNTQCFATASNPLYSSASAVVDQYYNKCYVPNLHYNTAYDVSVDAIAGGITGQQGNPTQVVTLHICMNLVLPAHTEVIDEFYDASNNSFASLACDEGYYLGASSYADGRNPISTWTGFPSVRCDSGEPCTDVSCTYKAMCLPKPCLTTSFNLLHYNIISPSAGSYGYGDSATIMCADGWAIGGNLGSTLQIHCICPDPCASVDASWDAQPFCVPVANCTVPSIADGSVSASMNAKNEIPSGDALQYSCNNGYEMLGANSAVCNNGSLVPSSLPTCSVLYTATCVSVPANGAVLQINGGLAAVKACPGGGYMATLGTTITLGCNSGYSTQGPTQQTVVLNGAEVVWNQNPQQLTCNIMWCSCLEAPYGGQITQTTGQSNGCPGGVPSAFGATVTIECICSNSDNCYFMNGPTTKTCVANGNSVEWSGSTFSCAPYPCTQNDPCVHPCYQCENQGTTSSTCVCSPQSGYMCCGNNQCCDIDSQCCGGRCVPSSDQCCGDGHTCSGGQTCCHDYCCDGGCNCCSDNCCASWEGCTLGCDLMARIGIRSTNRKTPDDVTFTRPHEDKTTKISIVL